MSLLPTLDLLRGSVSDDVSSIAAHPPPASREKLALFGVWAPTAVFPILLSDMAGGEEDKATPPQVKEPPPFELNDSDRIVLSQTDEEFHLLSWEELRDVIGTT